MNREIIRLYDEYTHTPLDRRTFLERLALLAGSAMAAESLLPLLENNYAMAAIVAEDDARLECAPMTFDGPAGKLQGYRAAPKERPEKIPAVLVIHENRGLNAHIKDVARRCAVAGYLAIALDALSPVGGTPADEDKARELIQGLDSEATLKNFLAALEHLRTASISTGRVGCVGFCWGGAMTNRLAVNDPKLNAAVAFYGMPAATADVPKMQAPLLLHYAESDERINAAIPEYEKALKEAKKTYTLHMYPAVEHAFHNDTNVARYNKEAADLAWQRTLDFFAKHLVS